ncbi:MAG: hypothetical protein U0X41_04490 [Chitinophagales bacterium]
MRNLLSALLFVSAFTACKKWETDAPSVHLSFPVAADTVLLADSLSLQCNISDPNLRHYKVIIYNFYTRRLFYKEEGEATAGTFTLDKKIHFEMLADTTAYINVLGIDKNGNTGGAGAKFYLRK